jgi:hypothetical protein
VTDSVVARRISGLKELRSEVGQLQKICQVLNNEVAEMSQTIASRPCSTMARARGTDPALAASLARKGPRVRWDPNVLELAKQAKANSKGMIPPSVI